MKSLRLLSSAAIFTTGLLVGSFALSTRADQSTPPEKPPFAIVGYNPVALYNEIQLRVSINLLYMALFDTPEMRAYAMGYQRGAGDVVVAMQGYGWLPSNQLPPNPNAPRPEDNDGGETR